MEGAVRGISHGESLQSVGVGGPYPALVLGSDRGEELLHLAKVTGFLALVGHRLTVHDPREFEVIGEVEVQVGADDLEGEAVRDAR
jgi:hypothetical protein